MICCPGLGPRRRALQRHHSARRAPRSVATADYARGSDDRPIFFRSRPVVSRPSSRTLPAAVAHPNAPQTHRRRPDGTKSPDRASNKPSGTKKYTSLCRGFCRSPKTPTFPGVFRIRPSSHQAGQPQTTTAGPPVPNPVRLWSVRLMAWQRFGKFGPDGPNRWRFSHSLPSPSPSPGTPMLTHRPTSRGDHP